MAKYVNDQELEERILEADTPVAIAFLAYDSIPARHFEPEYDSVADEFRTRMEFHKINVEENPTITEDLGVDAVPTMLIFRDSDEIARYEGPYSSEALMERIGTLFKEKKL